MTKPAAFPLEDTIESIASHIWLTLLLESVIFFAILNANRNVFNPFHPSPNVVVWWGCASCRLFLCGVPRAAQLTNTPALWLHSTDSPDEDHPLVPSSSLQSCSLPLSVSFVLFCLLITDENMDLKIIVCLLYENLKVRDGYLVGLNLVFFFLSIFLWVNKNPNLLLN